MFSFFNSGDTTMSASKATLVAVFAITLCSSAAWAASFPVPHRAHKNACPIAVENVGAIGQTAVQNNMANHENKAGKATDKKNIADAAPPAKGQNGLLLPAVKQGKALGQVGVEAGKAEAAGAK
jgi:hypothetical protein